MASAPGNSLETDVCIAGGGPAGLTLASALGSAGASVVLLESGESSTEPDPLDDGEVAGEGFDSLTSSRRRGLGGTAQCWNTWLRDRPAARYVALDPIDFETRSWVPLSGWPIDSQHLARWYHGARQVVGAGGSVAPDEYLVGLASVFTETLPERLRSTPGVVLRTQATVTRVELDRTRERVEWIEWTDRNNQTGRARASRFVLAMGTVENTRQLLLAGLGGPWTGCGFMDHPRDRTLRIVDPTSALGHREEFFDLTPGGASWGRWGRLAISEAELRRLQIYNASGTLIPSYPERTRLWGPLRRLLGRPRSRAYHVEIHLEQAPDRANRVTLSNRTDRFGNRLPRLSWQWNRTDEASRVAVRELFRQRLAREGFGRVEVGEQPIPDPNAHHHAGTTRMAGSPDEGVVDASCRVFGVENLYIAGASVFPTGGFANPTLTIVALALRLADHLLHSKR